MEDAKEGKIIDRKLIVQGKFQNIWEYQYISKSLQTKTIEVVAATSSVKGIHGIRAISYIPNELGGMQFVLIANHRIPCNAFVLEFAAGAPDPNETMSQCALRELHEETGFVGEIDDYGTKDMIVLADCWKSEDNGVHFVIKIDSEKKPIQQLDDTENIRVHIVNAKDFMKEIKLLITKYGYAIDSQLWSFAIGWTLSSYLFE